MSKHAEVYDGVENIVAKLSVLKDSCIGIFNSEKYNPGSIWFQGAGAILEEAVGELKKVLKAIEGGELYGSPVTSDTEKETTS